MASTRTPRFQSVEVAMMPSGTAIMTESRVPATAMAIVCISARSTVCRKSAETSGGNNPLRNLQTANAVAR
jgi:hypothetical protein